MESVALFFGKYVYQLYFSCGVCFYIYWKVIGIFKAVDFSTDCTNTENCLMRIAQCPHVSALFRLCFHTPTTQVCPRPGSPLCIRHLRLLSFQTAWVLTSPGYSPSSLTSLPCSTSWTKWSVLVAFVPGTLKTMAALAGLRWKGSPWMKLMSKSYSCQMSWSITLAYMI